MARPKSATHDIKRDAILDIAAQCFADRSYPAASMSEIATAAALPRPGCTTTTTAKKPFFLT